MSTVPPTAGTTKSGIRFHKSSFSTLRSLSDSEKVIDQDYPASDVREDANYMRKQAHGPCFPVFIPVVRQTLQLVACDSTVKVAVGGRRLTFLTCTFLLLSSCNSSHILEVHSGHWPSHGNHGRPAFLAPPNSVSSPNI